MVNIQIRSKSLAKVFKCDKPWVAISISTYDTDFPVLDEENRVALLQLAFKDVDLPGRSGGINSDQARQILDFFSEWHEQIDTLLIHCEFGASRSPAVGAVLSKIWYGADKFFFDNYTPNMFVYRAIMNEACGDEKLLAMMVDHYNNTKN